MCSGMSDRFSVYSGFLIQYDVWRCWNAFEKKVPNSKNYIRIKSGVAEYLLRWNFFLFFFFFCLKVHWDDIQVFRKFVVTIKQYLTASVRSFSASEKHNDGYFAHYLRAIIILCRTKCFRDKCRNTYYQTRVIMRDGKLLFLHIMLLEINW